MRTKNFREHGQVLVLIALAAVGLFAMVGLAIDGSAKFSDQRHAQNAADTAALAGALSLVNGNITEINGVKVWKLDAYHRAEDNGYVGDLLNNQVWVFQCSDPLNERGGAPVGCGAEYEGDNRYVQVVIDSFVDTTFARVVGINQLHNRVQATTYAVKRGPFYDGNLIVALNPNPCSGGGADGNITLGTSGGSTGVINLVGGGAFVNSGGINSCGMTLTGCPTVTITDGTIGSSGSGNIDLENSSGTCSANITAPEPTYENEPYPFPPEMPEVPDECTSPAGSWSSNSATHVTTLRPGRYNEFPPKSGGGVTVYDDVVMEEGVYCVNNVIKLTDQHLHLSGENVTIFIRSGYSFSFSGGSIDLDAPEDGPYAGYVIIVDSNFTGMPNNCKIDGNGENNFKGTIFAPYCNLTINGTSDPTSYNAQIIAYTVKLNGSAAVNLYYNVNDNAENFPKIGLMK